MDIATLAAQLGATCHGDVKGDLVQIASLDRAERQHLSFDNSRKARKSKHTAAGAVLVQELPEPLRTDVCYLLVAHVDYARLLATELLNPQPVHRSGIHPAAVIDASASIATGCVVGAGVVIGEQVTIASGCRIGANTVIERDTSLGEDCIIAPNVTIMHGSVIGNRVHIESGVVIGGEGFGLVKHEQVWKKIPQIGKVIIEDDVAIGPNSCVDRGAIEDTILRRGVKIDNLIQIGHNVEVGEHTAIAAHAALAGSTKIGQHCAIGGCSGFSGHIEIGDHSWIAGMSCVTKSLPSGQYASVTPIQEVKMWRKNMAYISNLYKILRPFSTGKKQQTSTGKES